MGIWLRGLNDLRTIEWGKKWLWDIQIVGAPEPFNNWFPASTVEENLWTLNEKEFSAITTSFSIPEKSAAYTLSITTLDDIKHTIAHWLEVWVDEILGGGKYTQSLEEAVKEIRIAKLANKNELVSLNEYWVVPKGSYMFEGASDAEAPSDKLDFIIAGIKGKKTY